MLSDEMIIRLDNIGFMVSHKSACDSYSDDGSYVLIAVGASQTEARENIRITTGRETSIDDIKALIKAISNIYYKYKNIK
ncbi:MAG: hypothetical protein QM532_03310 [Cyanobium sp. MAG06]|nr:hypothetical protein [Cyanobium sp. MAG06]